MKKFKRILLIAVNALCLLGVLAGVVAFTSIRKTQISQDAATRWRGESDMRFAQVSVFTPKDAASWDSAGIFESTGQVPSRTSPRICSQTWSAADDFRILSAAAISVFLRLCAPLSIYCCYLIT